MNKWELKLNEKDLSLLCHPPLKREVRLIVTCSLFPDPQGSKSVSLPWQLNRFLCFLLECALFPLFLCLWPFPREVQSINCWQRGKQGSGPHRWDSLCQSRPQVSMQPATGRSQPTSLKRQTQPCQLTPVSFSSGHDYRQVTAFSVQKPSLLCPQPGI